MNIALHGIETTIVKDYRRKNRSIEKPILVRYADDLVIFHSDEAKLLQAAERAKSFLHGMGLEFKASKTRVTHTLQPHHGNVGFNFLGFTVRQFPVGKTHSGKKSNGQQLGYKTIISPSKEAIKRHTQELKEQIRMKTNLSQEELIRGIT